MGKAEQTWGAKDQANEIAFTHSFEKTSSVQFLDRVNTARLPLIADLELV